MFPTLLELSSRLVSERYPFQLIEERYKVIPEPVQRKIIFYSFPRDEKYILLYTNNTNFNPDHFTINNTIQIGFHITANVTDKLNQQFPVFINFDRCKITSVSCSCLGEKIIFWCDHVVALAIHRIRQANTINLRVPISETLLQMDRSQLQKLVQYLVTTHTEVLPTAQNLADDLLTANSKINQIHGAPDPTAGPAKDDEHSWALNETQINTLLKEFINHQQNEQLLKLLFNKTLSMLSHRDSNGPRILKLITVQFLSKSLPEKYRDLWDELSNLWKITVMCPSQTPSDRTLKYKKTLKGFISSPNMPPLLLNTCLDLLKIDYIDVFLISGGSNNKSSSGVNKSAIKYPPDINALRVQALKCHGFGKESINLAIKIIKLLKKSPCKIEIESGLILYNTLSPTSPLLALEIGLLTLGQPRPVPNDLYLQEKYLKSEESLIKLLESEPEPHRALILNCACALLKEDYAGSVPLFNFSKYLYKSVSIFDSNLAFKLAMKFLKNTVPQTYITTNLEQQQVSLALTLINSNKSGKGNLDLILKSITQNIKSVSSLFKLAQESSRLSEDNYLLDFSFNLGLHVLKCTLRINHRKRWDIVRWIMNNTLTAGFYQTVYLLNNWVEFFTPNEAVGTVANHFLSRATSLRLNINYHQQQTLAEAARALAVLAMRHDPGNCALNGLTICEADPVSFETSYQIILEAAKKDEQLNCQQIFTIARYMEHRGYPLRAYKLAAIAIGHLHIPFNQETHSSISDIHWTCNLAQSLDSSSSSSSLSNLLPVIIANIKCASVLCEILKRAALEPPPRKCPTNNPQRNNKIYNRLKLLVEATISSYISTIHNRLTHISPRHYADFIEYLAKAKECFLYAPDGNNQFNNLINSIKIQYKGKKKLLLLLIERFG